MLKGKSIMSYNVPAVFGGDPTNYTQLLIDGKFERVAIKAADGSVPFNVSKYGPWPNWGENVKPELITALRASGFKIDFWHFVYGDDPAGELRIAQSQCNRFQPDGYIWNVETAFDRKYNAVNNAHILSEGLKMSHPYIGQGLCWWALPESPSTGTEWHPKAVAQAFLQTVDVGMPMEYWQGVGPTAAINYLHNSLAIWRRMTDVPIVPIGRCFDGVGGYTDGPSIIAFAEEVYRLKSIDNLVGNSWYVLDKAVQNGTWFSALQDTPKWGTITSLSLEEKVDRLVDAHPDLFPELN